MAHALWLSLRRELGFEIEFASVSAGAGTGTYRALQAQEEYRRLGFPTDELKNKKAWAVRVMGCLLEQHHASPELRAAFASGGRKQDDLADSFLQVLSWYRLFGKQELRRDAGLYVPRPSALASKRCREEVEESGAGAGTDEESGAAGGGGGGGGSAEEDAPSASKRRRRQTTAPAAGAREQKEVGPMHALPAPGTPFREALSRALPEGSICCYLVCPPHDVPKGTPRTYKGYTTHALHRLRQHSGALRGGAKATSAWGGARLCATVDGFATKEDALSFEWRWKHAKPSKRRDVPRMPGLFDGGPHGSQVAQSMNKLLALLHGPAFAHWKLRVIWWLGPPNQLRPVLPAQVRWAAFDPRIPDDTGAAEGGGGSEPLDAGGASSSAVMESGVPTERCASNPG